MTKIKSELDFDTALLNSISALCQLLHSSFIYFLFQSPVCIIDRYEVIIFSLPNLYCPIASFPVFAKFGPFLMDLA